MHTFVRAAGDASEDGRPGVDVGFGNGAEAEEGGVGVLGGGGAEFVEEAFGGWRGGGSGRGHRCLLWGPGSSTLDGGVCFFFPRRIYVTVVFCKRFMKGFELATRGNGKDCGSSRNCGGCMLCFKSKV